MSVSAGDIFRLGAVALKLWELAFSKAKNAAKLYADFGVDIQHLSGNLKQLGRVIRDVTRQVPSLSADDHKWDLKALPHICGDFKKTLNDCERLLKDQSKFSQGRGGFIYNIQWNLALETEVAHLKDRVAFHNIKILAILKPLELKLLLDLKSDIHDFRAHTTLRFNEVQDDIRKLQRHFTGNLEEETPETPTPPSALLEVPQYLKVKFEAAVRATDPDLQDDLKFPLIKGVNAFHHHFEQGTYKFQPEFTAAAGDYLVEQTPEPTRFLNLMKSIWVIQQVKKGEEYAEAASDELWYRYIEELEQKCERESRRFTAQEQSRKRLLVPDRVNLDLLREEEFRIWLDDDEEDDIQPGTDYLKQILQVLLSSPRNRKLELILLRHSDLKLEMQIISSKTTGPPNRQVTITDVNLETTVLKPLYANPMSVTETRNITFKGDSVSGRTTVLGFLRDRDLFDFQQAITGYKVVYNETDVKILTYVSTSLFSKGKQTKERGKIQIWTPRPLELSLPATQNSGATGHHRKSVTTTSSKALSFPNSFTTLVTSPVQTEDFSSVSFQMPGVPIVVFFLGPDDIDSEKLSFLTLDMDNETMIINDRCACNKKKSSCLHVTIERSSELVGRRVELAGENDELNLATLGTFQKPKNPELVKKLRYAQIEFKTEAERLKFAQRFEETKRIYQNKVHRYHEEMRQARGNHIV